MHLNDGEKKEISYKIHASSALRGIISEVAPITLNIFCQNTKFILPVRKLGHIQWGRFQSRIHSITSEIEGVKNTRIEVIL